MYYDITYWWRKKEEAMLYVILIAFIGVAAGLFLTGKKDESEYEGYEKFDADPKWNLKHLIAIALLMVTMAISVAFDDPNRPTAMITNVLAAFLVMILIMNIRDPKNRYIYTNRNKIVVGGELIDKKTVKGYSISGFMKNRDLVTYNGRKYRITKGQCNKLIELSKQQHFPFDKVV